MMSSLKSEVTTLMTKLPTVVLIVLLLVSQCVVAKGIQDLLSSDEIRIKTWLDPDAMLVPNQQIKLQIEVSSLYRLGGGIKIGLFEIDDAIMMRREKFGFNSSYREGAKTWTSQRWSIAVYPRRSGKFKVPSIPLKLSIADTDQTLIVGDVTTKPFTFNVEPLDAPAISLLKDKQWVATHALEAIDATLENLAPGDAAIVRLELTAPNIPAMMLPRLQLPETDGIAMYYKAPELKDKSNRGVYQASSWQQVTFVFEQPGTYQLDTLKLYWWNLETDEIETIELALPNFIVGSHQGVDSTLNSGQASASRVERDSFKYIAISIVFLVALYLLLKAFRWLGDKYQRRQNSLSTTLTDADIQSHFYNACKREKPEEALLWLYRWLDRQQASAQDRTIRAHLRELDRDDLLLEFNRAAQEIYATNEPAKFNLAAFGKRLMTATKPSKQTRLLTKYRTDLKLN
jgi:hypothetical protein